MPVEAFGGPKTVTDGGGGCQAIKGESRFQRSLSPKMQHAHGEAFCKLKHVYLFLLLIMYIVYRSTPSLFHGKTTVVSSAMPSSGLQILLIC